MNATKIKMTENSKREKVLVVDTETTGFAGGLHTCLVEIGVVLAYADTLEEIGSWGSLVRPRLAYDPAMDKAFEITGLRYDDLTEEKIASVVFAELRAWLVKNDAVGIGWVAYNTPFDSAIIRQAMLAAGVKGTPRWTGDILRVFRNFAKMEYSGKTSGKLSNAAKLLGVTPDGDLHRATTDARLALDVWREIKRKKNK